MAGRMENVGFISSLFLLALIPITLVLVFNFPELTLPVSIGMVVFAAILAALFEKFVVTRYSKNEKARKTAFYFGFLAYLLIVFFGEKIFIVMEGFFESLLQNAPFFSGFTEEVPVFAEICALAYFCLLLMVGGYYLFRVETKRWIGLFGFLFKWNLPENTGSFVRKHKIVFACALVLFLAVYFLNAEFLFTWIMQFQYSHLYSGEPENIAQLLTRYLPIAITTAIVFSFPTLIAGLLFGKALKEKKKTKNKEFLP